MARNRSMKNFTISGLLNANSTFTTTLVTKLFNQTTTTTTTSTTTFNNTTDYFNTTTIQNSADTPLEKFFVSTKYCLVRHHDSFCNYVSFCIFFGYVLRFLIMPFLIVRIDKLKLNLRNDYNFSLTWLWLFATGVFIDIIEYILTGDTTVYTRFITLLNIMLLIMVVVTISKYMYFYGYKESNLKNYMLGIVFLLFWLAISMIRIKLVRRSIAAKYNNNNNKKFNNDSNIVPIYVMIYLCFAVVQVSKNVINETGRCLTHMAFGLWLINLFFFSPYQIVVSSHNFDYIHYRTFFEMTTLLVILMQNIYYRDRKYSMTQLRNTTNDDLIAGREMSSNVNKKRIFKRNPLSKEFSNSGYLYFNDDNNVIDENKLYGGRKSAETAAKSVEYKDEIQTNPNEEDEVYFDKIQLSKKVNSLAVNNSKQEKVTTVDYNEELQSNELPMNIPKRNNVQAPTTPLTETEFRQPLRQKIGIFFSYSSSRMWIIMLIVFCTFYYLFSCFLLFRAVKKNPFLILCPFVHPITILVAWTYKRWVNPTRT